MTTEPAGLREMLRSQKVFPDWMPEFDPNAVPDDPVTLFRRWLEAAIQDAVPAPHAMTLATADDRGLPSARVLICKDVDTGGRPVVLLAPAGTPDPPGQSQPRRSLGHAGDRPASGRTPAPGQALPPGMPAAPPAVAPRGLVPGSPDQQAILASVIRALLAGEPG
jgi:hypothetical protein